MKVTRPSVNISKTILTCSNRSPVAVWSKAYGCSRSIAGISVSNSAEETDVCLLCLLCVVQVAATATAWSLVQKSPIGCVCDLEPSTVSQPKPDWGWWLQKKKQVMMTIWTWKHGIILKACRFHEGEWSAYISGHILPPANCPWYPPIAGWVAPDSFRAWFLKTSHKAGVTNCGQPVWC